MGWKYFYDLSESQPLFGGLPKSLEWLPLIMDNAIENEEAAIRARAKTAMANYRASKGWTLAGMATYLGVRPKSYEKYEDDPTRGVPLAVIARFCRYSGVDLDWIMYGKRTKVAS